MLEAQARGVPGALLERCRLLWARDKGHRAMLELQLALQQQLEAGEIKGPALLTALGLSLWTQEACSGFLTFWDSVAVLVGEAPTGRHRITVTVGVFCACRSPCGGCGCAAPARQGGAAAH